ncbi:transglycosylase SLT domain-containing protein [Rhizobium mongolense]|uniref:lytic transglycosylase domain-containing protein n=1 Tax=Rhizobium TaxID=379 RepID=UPI00188EF721|nr:MULTISPECIES: lytic transglycosylase domain-containing protein [unclassified Rhizobium]QPB21867.1 lytic transglycosylase domain-containing protein [Rhizobium sp. 007]WFU85799.1 lytic transglycosylase domain-containing protein [Rhizobium sp. CC1099]
MVANGFSGLKRGLVVTTMLCGIAGCSTVEYTSQAELTAVQSVVPTPKPGEDAMMMAAVPAADGTSHPETAFAASNPQATPALTAAATAMPATATSADPAMQQAMTASGTQIPLTPEMTAIQSVVPTPRPGTPASPSNQLAFAATAPQSGALAAIASVGPTRRSMSDFTFDESGPMDPPAAPPMFSDSDIDTAPTAEKSFISKLISKYSKLYEVPETLIHRVVHRESRYNPKAYNKRGYFGLMQIKYNTAKSMGYDGAPTGLLDAETNIKYAAKYLRGAWLVSDNKEEDAVRLYARGYYYDAKRKGMTSIAQGNY